VQPTAIGEATATRGEAAQWPPHHLLVERTGLLRRVLVHAAALREVVTAPWLLAAALATDPQGQRRGAARAYRRHARRLWLAAAWGGGGRLSSGPDAGEGRRLISNRRRGRLGRSCHVGGGGTPERLDGALSTAEQRV
jgi:hypothetical protein